MLNPVFHLETPATLGLSAYAFTLHDLANQHYSSELEQRLQHLRNDLDPQREQASRLGFEELRLRIGRSPRRFPASPQSLAEHYQRTGQLRTISPVVDLYNHWSLHSGLSIGAHDLGALQLPVSLAICRGDEKFHGLGSTHAIDLPPGEYAYLDANGQVLCRMEYRQCAASALQAHTRAALFIVQGHPHTDPEHLRQVAEALKADLKHYCCGHRQSHRVA